MTIIMNEFKNEPLEILNQYIFTNTEKWYKTFNLVKQYYIKTGKLCTITIVFEGVNIGIWTRTQRYLYRKNKLSINKILLLESIPGWWWKKKDTWYKTFDLFKKYVAETGKMCNTLTIYKNTRIGRWMTNQRKRRLENKLSSEKIKLLESVPNWRWSVHKDTWYIRYILLKKYIAETGKICIYSTVYENIKLGTWVVSQRRRYRYKIISKEKINLLESIPEWQWDPKQNIWDSSFNLLKEYVIETKRMYIYSTVYKDIKIGLWAAKQRQYYRAGRLDIKKINLLESIPGWSWKNKRTWNESFILTKEYVSETGVKHIYSNLTYKNVNIGRWAYVQRLYYRNKKLSENKIKLLETIPIWNWSIRQNMWDISFNLLKEYVMETGQMSIYSTTYKSIKIGLWATRQRQNYWAGKLSLREKELLESIPGWYWKHAETWNEIFELVKKYVTETKKKCIYPTVYGGKHIGRWVIAQRIKYRNNELSENKIKLLESIPRWFWDYKDIWNISFNLLKEYVEKTGHMCDKKTNYKGVNIGTWVTRHQQEYRRKELSDKKIKLLESVPGWYWRLTKTWEENFELIKKYVSETGEKRISNRITFENANIGRWARYQRIKHQNNLLSEDKIKLLETIPEWNWKINRKT